MDVNGFFLSLTILKDRFQLNCNFMEYYSLIYAIPNNWKRSVKREEEDALFQSSQEELLAKIMTTDKVCKMIGNICVGKFFKSPVSEDKWSLLFNDIDLNWPEIYKIPLSSSRSTQLRYFQFKIIHRYIGTNQNLFKFGYVDSNSCFFCKNYTETIQHLFWECNIITQFWNEVQMQILLNQVHLNMKSVLLGIWDLDTSKFNFVILHGKKIIYDVRCNQGLLNIQNFIRRLKNISYVEKNIANTSRRMNEWNTRWNSIVLNV